MRLTKTVPATIYTFEVNDKLSYELTCSEGIVVRIEKQEAQPYEGGDAESGPRMYWEMVSSELNGSQVYFERDLVDNIESIIKDAEAYTTYCMMSAADYSRM